MTEKAKTAKRFLATAYWANLHIDGKLRQVQNLRAMATRITQQVGGESVCRSRNTHSMEDTLVKIIDLEKEIDVVNAAALSNKLCQMSNGAIYDEDHGHHHIHDGKLDALEDLVESANRKPVLIAYRFKHDKERIMERFNCRELKTPTDIRDWNAGKITAALIHPAAAGHGLNLQSGGNTLIWFGMTWSLELYQQTNARLWRQGQTSGTVVIHHIITEDTIDEQILAALERKDKTQNALIEAVKAELEK